VKATSKERNAKVQICHAHFKKKKVEKKRCMTEQDEKKKPIKRSEEKENLARSQEEVTLQKK